MVFDNGRLRNFLSSKKLHVRRDELFLDAGFVTEFA